jgi:hypothetical protein
VPLPAHSSGSPLPRQKYGCPYPDHMNTRKIN